MKYNFINPSLLDLSVFDGGDQYTSNQQAQSAILKLWLYNKDYNPGYKIEDTSNNSGSHGDSAKLLVKEDDFDDWDD